MISKQSPTTVSRSPGGMGVQGQFMSEPPRKIPAITVNIQNKSLPGSMEELTLGSVA